MWRFFLALALFIILTIAAASALSAAALAENKRMRFAIDHGLPYTP